MAKLPNGPSKFGKLGFSTKDVAPVGLEFAFQQKHFLFLPAVALAKTGRSIADLSQRPSKPLASAAFVTDILLEWRFKKEQNECGMRACKNHQQNTDQDYEIHTKPRISNH